MKDNYRVIGLMSGTSLDGLDIACVDFVLKESWHFKLIASSTVAYPEVWKTRLVNLLDQDAITFAKTHHYYGRYLGEQCSSFIAEHQLKNIDAISSHGQTIFHDPDQGFTIQIGNGSTLATSSGLPVISDLRSADMAYGGQGAPIVPLGEAFLWPEFSAFLNIGGISNISIHNEDSIIGYDVCMGNLIMDMVAEQEGLNFDEDGRLAASGKVNDEILRELNQHPYLKISGPKSLDAGQVFHEFLPIIKKHNVTSANLLATLCEHIAMQIASATEQVEGSLFISGGGGLNSYLVSRIKHHCSCEIYIPSRQILEFKEAIIMAFLGLRRLRKQANVLASVTGASKDSINGSIYLP